MNFALKLVNRVRQDVKVYKVKYSIFLTKMSTRGRLFGLACDDKFRAAVLLAFTTPEYLLLKSTLLLLKVTNQSQLSKLF